MKIAPYLGFDGACAEAFRFYERVLRGKIDMMMTYGESPEADRTAPDQRDRIMHAHMMAAGQTLMGGDAPKGMYSAPAGFCVSIDVPEEPEAERIFRELSEGGQIRMPLGETFWAKRFAMFVDRYGTPWIVNCPKPM
ncbi:MAG: VOC family protein [Hyphomicrobiales bacterium]|nr:VOC family protein [Hyphomicrobiales bacterium]